MKCSVRKEAFAYCEFLSRDLSPTPSVNRFLQNSCLSSPRLSGTNFSIPEAIYSLNSLGDLNRYSKPVALLKHKADKDSAWLDFTRAHLAT